jgi:polyhydroxyalkanoate synthesis regulator protein
MSATESGIRAEDMDDLVRSAVDFLLENDKTDEAEAVTVLVEIIADLRQPDQGAEKQP